MRINLVENFFDLKNLQIKGNTIDNKARSGREKNAIKKRIFVVRCLFLILSGPNFVVLFLLFVVKMFINKNFGRILSKMCYEENNKEEVIIEINKYLQYNTCMKLLLKSEWDSFGDWLKFGATDIYSLKI